MEAAAPPKSRLEAADIPQMPLESYSDADVIKELHDNMAQVLETLEPFVGGETTKDGKPRTKEEIVKELDKKMDARLKGEEDPKPEFKSKEEIKSNLAATVTEKQLRRIRKKKINVEEMREIMEELHKGLATQLATDVDAIQKAIRPLVQHLQDLTNSQNRVIERFQTYEHDNKEIHKELRVGVKLLATIAGSIAADLPAGDSKGNP